MQHLGCRCLVVGKSLEARTFGRATQLLPMPCPPTPPPSHSSPCLSLTPSSTPQVVAWYDNEWGYSQRVVDLAEVCATKWE